MKRLLSISLAVLFLMAAAVIVYPQPAPQANASAIGTWDITIESPQGTRNTMLVIKQEGAGLVGAMKSAQGERPLKSVAVQGNDITMVMTIPFQGDEMTITYKGKIEKDSMKGTADFGGLAEGTWSAVVHKENTAPATTAPAASSDATGDISGVWQLEVTLDSGGTGSPTFTFKQEGEKLTGTYKGSLGEAPVTGTIKGMDVKFGYKINVQGNDLEGTYTGKLTGKDTMAGTIKFSSDELGSGKWTAKKK